MTPASVQLAVADHIHRATAELLPWFQQPSPLRAWLPPGGGWNIDEILHHITLTSHYLLILIEKGRDKSLRARDRGETLDWPEAYSLSTEQLLQVGEGAAFPWHRPEHMDPRIHPATQDVKTRFLEQMARCESILQDLEGGWGIKQATTMTVNGIGKMDVYQYIVFLCLHVHRHIAQMHRNLAMKASLG